MSTAQNKELARRFIEDVLNTGNLAAIDDFMAAGYVEHLATPGFPANREGTKMALTMLHRAFPDFHYTIEHLIADDDWVAMRLTGHATMQGSFRGLPPTGKQASWSKMHFARLDEGKFVLHWDVKDDLNRLQQLGFPPIPERK